MRKDIPPVENPAAIFLFGREIEREMLVQDSGTTRCNGADLPDQFVSQLGTSNTHSEPLSGREQSRERRQ